MKCAESSVAFCLEGGKKPSKSVTPPLRNEEQRCSTDSEAMYVLQKRVRKVTAEPAMSLSEWVSRAIQEGQAGVRNAPSLTKWSFLRLTRTLAEARPVETNCEVATASFCWSTGENLFVYWRMPRRAVSSKGFWRYLYLCVD